MFFPTGAILRVCDFYTTLFCLKFKNQFFSRLLFLIKNIRSNQYIFFCAPNTGFSYTNNLRSCLVDNIYKVQLHLFSKFLKTVASFAKSVSMYLVAIRRQLNKKSKDCEQQIALRILSLPTKFSTTLKHK